jgi:alkylation response protein AidB-like acyl-CoA dehydrogenase
MSVTANDLAVEFASSAKEMLASQMSQEDIRSELEREFWSEGLWRTVVDAGWLDVLLPEDLDGLGLGLAELAGIFTAVGLSLMPGPLLDNAVALPMVAARAKDCEPLRAAIRERSIFALVDGEASEQPHQDRPGFEDGRLSGRGELVRFGGVAELLLVVAEAGEPAVVLVDPAAAGVELSRHKSFDPVTELVEIRFDGVPAEPLVSAGPELDQLLAELRAAMRLMTSCEVAGVSRHMLDAAVGYAKEREQFERPIGSFQVIQHLLADIAADVTLLEATCEAAVAAWVSGEPGRIEQSVEAKGLAARVGRIVGEGALQVHGGIAFTREFDLHRWFMHVVSLQGLYGDERSSARRIGKALLEPQLEQGQLLKPELEEMGTD